MASSRLRSFIFVAFGFIAAAFIFAAPASAGTHEPGLYAATFHNVGYMVPELAVTPDHVAIQREETPAPHKTRSAPLLGPVYALSLETHGQSLADFHRRC